MFLTAKEVEESLERRETATCLAWCHDNKSRLRKMKVCGSPWWGGGRGARGRGEHLPEPARLHLLVQSSVLLVGEGCWVWCGFGVIFWSWCLGFR